MALFEVAQPVRVLIVNDDGRQAQMLQLGLATAAFEVNVVADGLAAVADIEARHYDAILVYCSIAAVDGLATAKLLGNFVNPVARPVLIALASEPRYLATGASLTERGFDLVLDRAGGVSGVISAITNRLEAAPAQQADRDQRSDRAGEVAVNGSRPVLTGKDDPDPIRILVAEDDEHQRSLLSTILERKGYVVETASDGLQAIQRIRENGYDLALLDYNLPEIDGLAVASLVHDQMTQHLRPKLVAVTATPDVLYVQTGVTGPVFDRIVDKSSGLDEVISSVDHLLRFSTNPETRRAAARILQIVPGVAPT